MAADPTTRKPPMDFNPLTQAGLKAHELGTRERAALEERLDAGVIQGLRSDLTHQAELLIGVAGS